MNAGAGGEIDEANVLRPCWGTSSRKLRTLVRTPSWANGPKETRNVTCYLRIVCHLIATLNTGDFPGPPSPARCLLRLA